MHNNRETVAAFVHGGILPLVVFSTLGRVPWLGFIPLLLLSTGAFFLLRSGMDQPRLFPKIFWLGAFAIVLSIASTVFTSWGLSVWRGYATSPREDVSIQLDLRNLLLCDLFFLSLASLFCYYSNQFPRQLSDTVNNIDDIVLLSTYGAILVNAVSMFLNTSGNTDVGGLDIFLRVFPHAIALVGLGIPGMLSRSYRTFWLYPLVAWVVLAYSVTFVGFEAFCRYFTGNMRELSLGPAACHYILPAPEATSRIRTSVAYLLLRGGVVFTPTYITLIACALIIAFYYKPREAVEADDEMDPLTAAVPRLRDRDLPRLRDRDYGGFGAAVL